MIADIHLHALAQMSAERLLNSLAEGLAIALFAWILLRLIGRRNSGTRFAVWFCALLAIAASPFIEAGSARSGVLHPSTAAITMPREWASYMFGAWALIALLGIFRVATGLRHLRTIRRSCNVVDPQDLHPQLRQTLVEFRSIRPVDICVSAELRVPTAIGLSKPAVVLPEWALRDLSATELNVVLLHELAHLRRWDDWTNLTQKILRALFFFHPAVWWVESRLALEREMACDDLVLAQTENPKAYAACLVSLAEKNLLRRGVALAQAAVGRMRQTSQRILRILDARASHVAQVWKPAPWVVGAFSITFLISSAHAPKLVAFGDATPRIVAQLGGTAALPVRFEQLSKAPAASVIQVSYTQRTSGAHTFHAKAKRRIQTPAIQRSNRTRAPQTEPVVVRASAPISPELVVPQQAVFVFMEGQRYGDAGQVLWHVSILRLMVDSQGRRQVVQEIFAKSI